MRSATTEPRRVRLDLALEPLDVLRRFRGRDRLVGLLGAWHHGEALVAFDPVAVADDPFADVVVEPLAGPGFGGGWIGVWGHRLGGRLERLPDPHARPVPQPDHRVAFYDRVLRLSGGTWWLETLGRTDDDDVLAALAADPPAPQPHAVGAFELLPTPDGHRAGVARVLEHVAAGDVFQVNLCARLEASFEGDPLDLFCAGAAALRPAYAAFVDAPEGAVASFSPELFLRRTGREVLTSPIKGTAPLDTDPAELVGSAKDRAENVMIVDLMRNDLGRVCAPGSVAVPALVRPERHAVWHLVSDVVGHLDAGIDDADLLRATFPPGSVTGAPKVRAMEVAAALEPTGREAYTGAIGHVSPLAGLELNVAIRTFEVAAGRVWLGVGGGVVADSTPEGEYAELLVKARPLVEAVGGRLDLHATAPLDDAPAVPVLAERPRADLQRGVFSTVLVVDGVPADLDAHLARLDASVRALYGRTVRAGLEDAVLRRARGLAGRHRLRVVAEPDSDDVRVRLEVHPLDDGPATWRLAPRLVPGGWGAHKWVDRDTLAPPPGATDVLVLDADGSVLEAGRASLLVVHDDGVHTPPLDGRILPGTQRARVVDALTREQIPLHQRRLTTADLERASEVMVVNALRGVVPVTAVDGVGTWAPGPVAARLGQLCAGAGADDRDVLGGARREPARGRRSQRDGGRPRVLFVDNYDSFVYNLVQYTRELGAQVDVVRNDEVAVEELVRARAAGDLTHVVVSPGPGTPADAGASVEVVRLLGPTTPVLGVCLGHQAIVEAYGGVVVRAPEVVHGKPSLVHHDGAGVMAGLPTPLACARYHSLVADEARLPEELVVTGRTAAGVVMGVRHRSHPVEGVQWHPESILTARGHDVVARFLRGPTED